MVVGTGKQNHTEIYNYEKMEEVMECNNIDIDNNIPQYLKNLSNYYHNSKTFDNKLGRAEVKYEKGKESDEDERMYAKPFGLQRMKRDLRAYVCDNMYYDIDLKNAHPTILNYLFKKYDINPNILLTKYVENREEILETYGISKDDFLSQINNSKLKIPVFKSLHQQIYKVLVPKLKESYKDLYTRTKNSKKYNVEGSFLSHVIDKVERKLLDFGVYYSVDNGFNKNLIVLCFDGFMLYKPDIPMNVQQDGFLTFLNNLNQSIKEHFEFDFIFADKDMISNWRPIYNPSNNSKSLIDLYEPPELVDDDTAAKTLCELASDTLVYCSAQKIFYIFDENTGLWDNSDVALKRLIHKHKDKLNFGQKTNYSGMFNKVKAMREFIVNHCICYDGFIEKNIETSMRKILFKNGIYDMVSCKFTEGFDKNIVFVDRIDRDYRDMNVINPKLIAQVNQTLLLDPFAEDKEVNAYFLKQAIAIGIAGEYVLKKGLWAVAPTNTAKGVITTALEQSFCGYIGFYNQNSLLFNKNSADEAKKLSWIFDLNNKRIVIGNEVKKCKDAKIDSNLVKSIISGGDNLQMRKNFKDEEDKKNRAFFINFLNDLLPFEPWDDAIDDRMWLIQFTRVFKDTPDDDETEGKKDVSLKLILRNNDDYKDAFVSIIFNSYRDYVKNGIVYPEMFKELKKEWVEDECPLQKTFDSIFEKTGMTCDYVIVSEMINELLPNVDLTKKKLEMELNRIVKTKVMKIDGVNTRVKQGVKRKNENNGNIIEDD